MVNLVLRSFIVLALLFGLVFAVGIMALFATGLPLWLAVPFAVIVVALQYLLGPFIIGRGVPGLFYSDDLVLQDSTGFIALDYRQPWRLFEFPFGLLRAEKYVGQSGSARGWFRRVPQPVFELRESALDDGKKVASWVYPLAQFMVVAILALGALAVIGQVALRVLR